jgi:energy-coupling factor transporter ATP-binding protein EcfA2
MTTSNLTSGLPGSAGLPGPGGPSADAVVLSDISRCYGRRRGVAALSGVTARVRRGSFTAVMGLSGSGKSTLLQCAGGLDKPDIGPFDRRVIAVGGIVFAALMALSARYGFDRDELYFLDCARHLQASYVDQPVLAPLLAWVSLKLFGVSLPGLRVWPALAAWATVVVAGLTAREFGGTRRAQLLAAAGTAMAPWLLASDHLANTTPYELLAWAALALVVVRIGRTGDCRWWLAGGLVAGFGVADDHSMSFFAIAVVIGALLSGGRRMIWNRWFAAGAVIAVAFGVPDLWWQAQHQWATIAMTEALNRENGGIAQIGPWILQQLGVAARTLPGVSVIGLWCLSRSGRPLWRALAWAYGLLFVLFAVTAGAKGYYLAAAYVYLLAAGAVAIDGWLQARPGRLRNLMLATAVITAVLLPEVLPVLPPADLGRTVYKSNPTPLETIGWPQLVRTVDAVWTSLPPSQRASAVIFTANYGEAGAINELGRGTGLPTAVSSQNSEWWWEAGNPHATTILAVAPGPVDGTGYGAYLGQFFTHVRVAAALSNPYGLHNQEWGGHVYICTGPRQPWTQIWPQLREYS